MSDSVSHKKSFLDPKTTNYDLFLKLKDSVSDATLRNTLEGAIIIASPHMAQSKGIRYIDAADAVYKLNISLIVRDELERNSAEDAENISDYTRILLGEDSRYFIFNDGKRTLNLPWLSLKLFSESGYDARFGLCRDFGREIESRFGRFYRNKGYETKLNSRPGNVGNYLRSEYEFFTRVIAESMGKHKVY